MNSKSGAFRILFTAFIITLSSCSTMGNGGSGAVGEVKGNVNDINQRTQSVFKEMNIHMVSADTENSGQQQNLGGMSGEEKITVQMTSSGDNTTRVEVSAKKGTLGWDKDLADQVLSKIVQS